MRLYEFADADPLRVKLSAITERLRTRLLSSNRHISTAEFLTFLHNNGINVSQSDLFDMVKKEPLVNIIANVNGDEVTFKGQESQGEEPTQDIPQPDDSKNTVKQMASRALK